MDIHISRSEQKRRLKQLEGLVEEISKLPAAIIKSLPCRSDIINHLLQVSTLKGGARKRELKYVTKLLKNDDEEVEHLYAFMAKKQGVDLQEKRDFHEIEYLRDTLVNEAIDQLRIARENQDELEENWPSRVLDEIVLEYPEIDRLLLGRLAWLFARTRNRKHSREIFSVLRSAQEQKRFAQKQKMK